MSRRKPKQKDLVTTLAVGEETLDGGLPKGIGIKTIEPGEPVEDQGPRPRRRNRDRPDESGEDGGA
jgi:hypothetical protein